MSRNTKLKRIAAVAVAALGLGMLSVVPANAAQTVGTAVTAGTGTSTAGANNGAVGAAHSFVITQTITDALATNTVTTTLTVDAPSGSAIADADWNDTANTSITGTNNGDYTFAAANSTSGAIVATAGAGAGAKAGNPYITYSFTPDAAGTWLFTIATTATAGSTITNASVTYTLTAGVVPTALYVSNTSGTGSSVGTGTIAIDKTGGASEGLIAGTGTAFASTDVGRALYDAAGTYLCTIGSVASATSANCLDNIAADFADAAFRLGSLSNPGNRVSNPILGSDQISSLTATAGARVNLVVKSTSGNQADASKLRVAINNVGTLATGLDPTAAGLSNAVNFAAPAVAGTYAMTITYSTDGTDFTNFTAPNAAAISFTLVVSAAATWSSALSTVYLGTGATAATAATDLLPVSASRTTGTQAANIRVALVNTSGVAYTGQTVTATISGSGFLGAAQTNAAADTADTTNGTLRSTSVTDTNGFVSVTVWPDGTAGKGTVTISVTDKLTLATTVLATKTVTFFGPVAKLTATANYTILAEEGAVTGGGVGGAVATTYINIANRINATDIPAVIVKAEDSAGNPVGGLTIQAVSSDSTVAKTALTAGGNSAAGCTADVLSAANLYSSGGTGFYNCALESATTAKSGNKATYTFRVLNPADPLGLAYLTATVDITIGGARYTETLSFDKATYAPGEQMVITRTAVDASGNPVYDGASAPSVIFNKLIGGTAITTGTYVGGKSSTSSSRPTVFAPTVPGTFEARMTGYVNDATAQIKATATVTDDAATSAANAASDAAAEAIDAANAATDAANLAAEAADAATVAAEEARDAADAATAAVEELATQVATLMAALKAQITTLANTVAKIAKKVKA